MMNDYEVSRLLLEKFLLSSHHLSTINPNRVDIGLWIPNSQAQTWVCEQTRLGLKIYCKLQRNIILITLSMQASWTKDYCKDFLLQVLKMFQLLLHLKRKMDHCSNRECIKFNLIMEVGKKCFYQCHYPPHVQRSFCWRF